MNSDASGLDGKYERMDHLKTKVINPALRDVNAHTDLEVTFGERRRGRAITHFQFKFQKKQTAAALPDRSGQKDRKTASTRAPCPTPAAVPYLDGLTGRPGVSTSRETPGWVRTGPKRRND